MLLWGFFCLFAIILYTVLNVFVLFKVILCCQSILFRLWESLGLELVPELCSLLIGDVTHHEDAVRSAAADALSSAVSEYTDQSATVLEQLTELYQKKLYVRVSILFINFLNHGYH